MDSDDDEDVIFKGSQLHEHLISSDYTGPEISYYNSGKGLLQSKDVKSNNLSWKTCASTWLSKWFNRNQEEEFGSNLIRCVTDSSLVSIEDADFLANMFDQRLAHQFEPTRNSNNFGIAALGGVVLSLAVLAAPTALPLALRLPSLLFVGFGALNALNWKMNDWKRKRLDHLLTEFTTTLKTLHSLCSSMSKSMQFIQEMELIDRGFTLPNLVTHLSLKSLRMSSQHSALLCLPLRRELVQVSVCLHRLCLTHTLCIRDRLPLSGAVDNASHYLACCGGYPPPPSETVSDNSEETAVITLQAIRASIRQCHLQLSEMLRRLALAFLIPVSDEHFNIIRQLNGQMQSQSTELGQRITTAHDYFTAWKVRETCSSPAAAPPLTHDGSLELALHSLEGHLMATNMLIQQSRIDDSINDLRVQLSHEFKSIATCWELVELELDKFKGPLTAAPSTPLSQPSVSISQRAVEKDDPVPLYGAWEPQVEDLEILEADLMHEPSIGDSSDMDDDLFALRETREERLARKRLMAAQSKLLYSELQVVLQSKAAEWKEREDKVMQRLGITQTTPSPPVITSDPPPLTMTYTEPVAVKFIPFNLQSSLAAQVRALASQRTVGQHEDVIGDDSSSSSSSDGESQPILS